MTPSYVYLHFPFSKHKTVKLEQASNMLELFLDDVTQRIQCHRQSDPSAGKIASGEILWIMGADLNTNMTAYTDRSLTIANIISSVGINIIPFKDPSTTTYVHAEAAENSSSHAIDWLGISGHAMELACPTNLDRISPEKAEYLSDHVFVTTGHSPIVAEIDLARLLRFEFLATNKTNSRNHATRKTEKLVEFPGSGTLVSKIC